MGDIPCTLSCVASLLAEVVFPEELLRILPEDRRRAAVALLAEDPRPAYQNDPERVYGVFFAGFNVSFRVDGTRLTVEAVDPMESV